MRKASRQFQYQGVSYEKGALVPVRKDEELTLEEYGFIEKSRRTKKKKTSEKDK